MTTPATTTAQRAQGPYDAVLLVSFGGPEGPEQVMPFLRNVVRGRQVPDSRLQEVAEHYRLFGGKSPINAQNRALLEALRAELSGHGVHLPLYWGNRNWHPLLTDTLAQMRRDGVRSAVAFVTSAYSSYSSCRQYLDDIAVAQAAIGPDAPRVDKIPPYYNHPGFVEAIAQCLNRARIDAGMDAPVLFSAHSIPVAMAAQCDYEGQLRQTAEVVAHRSGGPEADWSLVYQSRSGPPSRPWLGPDILEAIESLPKDTTTAVVSPIGFVSDHMEVVYDLDTEARSAAAARGIRLVRADTPGSHPRFVSMIRELIEERQEPQRTGLDRGAAGARAKYCYLGCCPSPSPPTPAGLTASAEGARRLDG